jgi:uncharacterized protein (TIGR02145 family)
VWVVGNARSNGSFSATVQLLAATADIVGACAYAPNYPPVAEYAAVNKIKFTGTPEYDIVLKHSNGTTDTLQSGKTFLVPDGYTLQSFSDNTGAPGIIKCIPMTGNINFASAPPTILKGQPATFTVNAMPTVPAASEITYSWSAPDFNPATHTGGTFNTTAPAEHAVYGVTLTARRVVYCDLTVTNSVTVANCITPATFTLLASAASFCAGAGVMFALSGTESGVQYQLYKGAQAVGEELPGTGGAATFSGTYAEGHYTAAAVGAGTHCAVSMSGAHTIVAYPAFTAGEIATASTATPAWATPGITVESITPATGGSGSVTYQWQCTGTGTATLIGDAATYTINDYDYAAGTYYINRYAKDATCDTDWVAASGTYTLVVEMTGVNQPQGSCTFTQPPVVGTFANFDPGYSASTFVTLTDERDGNNYTVVKIGGRWIMGQNLNYRKGLTYFATRATPSTSTGSVPALRGGFWCPSNSSGTVPVSVCDYWGAQYAWETAMMLDGVGTWTETSGSGYCTGAANTTACKQNFGRAAGSGTATGGRGICPQNWHVPTDFEWGVLLDAMESSSNSTAHQNASGAGWYGSNAGTRGKATCSGNSSDTNPSWDSGAGTDIYHFRIIPTDDRNGDGSAGADRGAHSYLWSSSAYSTSSAWYRHYLSGNANVFRNGSYTRSLGVSIRCLRDE